MAELHGGGDRVLFDRRGDDAAATLIQYLKGERSTVGFKVRFEPERKRFLLAPVEQHIVSLRSETYALSQAMCVLGPEDFPVALEAAHEDLGGAFDANGVDQPDAVNVPAAFTYLGQFIAHALSQPVAEEDGGQFLSAAPAVLSLGDLFDPPDVAVENQPQFIRGQLGIGKSRPHFSGRFDDLPRNDAGRAAVPDRRNDQNLAVAQMHALLVKFYQTIVDKLGVGHAAAAQIATRHFQSIVLGDYLPRIVDNDIWQEVVNSGRGFVEPGPGRPTFTISNEFAAACFRFGHTMVRNIYIPWNPPNASRAETSQLLDRSHQNDPTYRGLQKDWRASWPDMLDGGTVKAGRMGCHMPAIFTRLDLFPSLIDDFRPDVSHLGKRTLLRGLDQGLPSGQALARCVAEALAGEDDRAPPTALTASAVANTPNLALKTELERSWTADGVTSTLAERTPLWAYILREAEIDGNGGEHLGKLGSRIVMETIHAAIHADPNGILDASGAVDFVPDPNLHPQGAHYTLAALVACVDADWPG